MRELVAASVLGLWVAACGGSQPPAEPPEAAPLEATPPPVPPPPAEPVAEEPKEESKPASAPVAEPQFTDGMSVAEAEKAVPRGAERANIDQETMSKPIQDVEVYEPCKPGTAHVKIKIAVWDGRAVGIDVTTTPKNDKLAACITERIKGLKWQARVKSLNAVEYSF